MMLNGKHEILVNVMLFNCEPGKLYYMFYVLRITCSTLFDGLLCVNGVNR